MRNKALAPLRRKTAFLTSLLAAFSLLLSPSHPTLAAPIGEGIAITITPTDLRPADGGFIRITGGYPLAVSIMLDGEDLDVFWDDGGYMAFFAYGFDEQPGEHLLALEVYNPSTRERVSRRETITVLEYDFQQEQVAIPYNLLGLFDPKLNQRETAQLEEVYALTHLSPETDWPFSLPTLSPVITSRFGNDRVYGGGLWQQHHTGVDFRLGNGEPVLAVADGWVVFSEKLEVHGNIVAIDHGNGLMTSYSHLSEKLVREGMFVRQGQVIGLGGNTGRSSGPHLHLEVAINGVIIDPIRFMALTPYFVTPVEVKPEVTETGN